MADATDGTDDAGRLPGAFLETGSSSFVDFLGGHRPYLLPSRRRLPPVPPGFEPPHGTTIVGAVYDDGVLLAGDRRVTMGNQIAYRDYEKVFQADETSAVGIAGSTGLAEEMVGLFRMELAHYEKIEGVGLTLEGRANRLGTLIRGNLELATQGLAVVPVYAGYDEAAGRGRIFAYFVDGGRMEERAFAGTGSGSVFARGAMKKLYREGLSEAEAVTLAVQALYDAADDDTATGGPDPTRRLYPQITVITEDGFRRVPDDEVAETTTAVLRRRGERPDGPTAPVL